MFVLVFTKCSFASALVFLLKRSAIIRSLFIRILVYLLRSSDSYIDREVFFVFLREAFYSLFGLKFTFSRFDFFLKFDSLPLLKERQTPSSNSKSVKVTKNVINF